MPKTLLAAYTFTIMLITALLTASLFYFYPVTYSPDETATAYQAGLEQCAR